MTAPLFCTDIALAAACERRLLVVWPATRTVMHGDWTMRMAHGYSARANSLFALAPGSVLTPGLLAEMEALFTAEGIVPTVRISPLVAAGAMELLRRAGYGADSVTQTMVLTALPSAVPDSPATVQIADILEDAWLAGVSARQQQGKRNPDHLRAILSRLAVPARFATAMQRGEAVGFGLAVVDDDWAELASIIVDSGWRGRGLGRAVVAQLLAAAQGAGARQAFLQVEQSNAPAIALYEAFGFRRAYDYVTLKKVA